MSPVGNGDRAAAFDCVLVSGDVCVCANNNTCRAQKCIDCTRCFSGEKALIRLVEDISNIVR